MSVKENIMKFFVKSYARLTGVAQGQQVGQGDYSVTEGMPELLRSAAAEGAVLLENKVLPFKRTAPSPFSAGPSLTGFTPDTAPAVML